MAKTKNYEISVVVAKSDVLPTEPAGDNSQEAVWVSVGRALTAWENLQVNLARLFVAAADCGQHDRGYPVLRAFGNNMVVIAKLDMIKFAAEATLWDDPLYDKTSSLLNRIKGFNERRNDIAHGVVMQLYSGGKEENPRGYYLAPRFTTTKKYAEHFSDRPLQPAYSWTSAQIDRYTEAFIKLDEETKILTGEIYKFVADRDAEP